MQDQVELLGHGANAQQGAAKQGGQVADTPGSRKARALVRGLVHARQDPGFVRDARRVWAEGDVVAAQLNHPQALALFLADDVAEYAAFLLLIVVAAGAKFVKHTARNESRRSELRRRMFELLTCIHSVIFEDADILDAAIALEVFDALGSQSQELLDFRIAGIPQVAIVL